MTPDGTTDQVGMASQAAQHDDPTPAPVCPASPEGAMPLQSATLPHKKIPIPKQGLVAATQRLEPRMPRCEACGNALTPSDGKFCKACSIYGRPEAVTLDASNLLPDWKDLDLRPGNVWQMNPEPKMESYEGIPAEVINEATIMGDDTPYVVIQKLEAQMKGRWAMVRFGHVVQMPPEEMVNVRGEQRPVDEYCVATPVTIPTVDEALAMRDMVEKAAEAMRGRGASMPERSFLSLPRQHDSPLSARVVPSSEAPDPKVGW